MLSQNKVDKLRELAIKAYSEETEQSKQINIESHKNEEIYQSMKAIICLGSKNIKSLEKSIEEELKVMEMPNDHAIIRGSNDIQDDQDS